VAWILLVMLGMIGGSIVVELILPLAVKERLGATICWLMMAVTMTFLGAATVGLVFVMTTQVLMPLITG